MILLLGPNTAREMALMTLVDLGMKVVCEGDLRNNIASRIYSREFTCLVKGFVRNNDTEELVRKVFSRLKC